MNTEKNTLVSVIGPSADYALLDSGDGEKLERWGDVVLSRPDPQALWPKRLSDKEWSKADGHFSREDKNGSWSLKPSVPEKWPVSFGGLKFLIRPTAFKHVGLFPEQAENWRWMAEKIKNQIYPAKAGQANSPRQGGASKTPDTEDAEILNLFGYTGGATLSCAQTGAKVVHIDGSKAAVSWARENADLSGLADRPIRWIVEDARVFVGREIKRGRRYDGIIMDPPAFGHGPSNELWKIEEHLLSLIEDCKKLLKDQPLFFLINGYSAGYSAIAYENNLLDLKERFGGEIEVGELAIAETLSAKSGSPEKFQARNSKPQTERLLPAGIFARWSSAG